MADPNNPRKFTEEFRRQIVQLYLAGRPRGELMAEYDLGSSTLSRWIKGYGEAGVTTEAAARTPEDERLLELERENKRRRTGGAGAGASCTQAAAGGTERQYSRFLTAVLKRATVGTEKDGYSVRLVSGQLVLVMYSVIRLSCF